MKKIIRHAIERAIIEKCKAEKFDSIKVKEICEDCGISKPTFYKYYKDKYEAAAMIYLRDSGLEDDEKPYFSYAEIEKALTKIWNNRVFYRKALDSKYQNSLYEFLAQHTIQILKDYSEDILKRSLSEEEMYILKCYAYGWIHEINNWIRGEAAYSIANLAKYQAKTVPEFIRSEQIWDNL